MTTSDGRISTILAAKLAVTTMRSAATEQAASAKIRRGREILHSCITSHGGREFGVGGDTFLAEFPTSIGAIECAADIAERMRELSAGADDVDTDVGIGISLGDVIQDDKALYGDAVDTAKALRLLAGGNSIVVSGAVQEQAQNKTDLAFRRVRPPAGQKLPVSAYMVTGKDIARARFAFVQELIRRRILKAAGAYIIVSWILVQVASIIFPEFDFPEWSMRTLIVFLTVAFPLAMLLAWTVDITSSGFALTPDSQYSRTKGNVLRFGTVAVATAMSGAVLWWVWTDYIAPTTQRLTRAPIKTDPVIAVNAPRNRSGNDELDWLGEGVANLVRNELAESWHVMVISQSRWNEIASRAESPVELSSLANRTGIDYLVTGDYLSTPDGILLTSHVEDLENGIEIQGARFNEKDAAGIIAATEELAVQVKQALNVPLQDNVNQYSADFAVRNMAAYEAYIAGLSFLFDFDYQQAEESFRAALDLAPDFHMARFRLAGIMESTGRAEPALQELRRIPADANLTERERLYIEGARWNFTAERDSKRSIEVYRTLVDNYPYDIEAGQHLADAYWVDFQEDAAIDVLRGLAELHSYEPSSWMALGEMLLDVGQLAEAEAALTRYAEMAPEDQYGATLLGNLAQLQGEYGASIDFYDLALTLKPGFAVATLGLARSRYLAGDVAAAESLFRQLVNDADQSARFRIDAAFDFAGILRGQGQFSESMQPLTFLEQAIREEDLRVAMMDSTLGMTELERGNLERAAALIDRAIEESPGVATRYLFARGMLELRTDRPQDLENTVDEIRALALPPEDPDRTEDKAADYLLGLTALQQGDVDTAAEHLESAVAADGYAYAIYAVGLARLELERGRVTEASSIASSAVTARDPGDLRLDLELDRSRAMLLHARILAQLGRVDDARSETQRFIERWSSASAQAPDLKLAYELLATD